MCKQPPIGELCPQCGKPFILLIEDVRRYYILKRIDVVDGVESVVFEAGHVDENDVQDTKRFTCDNLNCDYSASIPDDLEITFE